MEDAINRLAPGTSLYSAPPDVPKDGVDISG